MTWKFSSLFLRTFSISAALSFFYSSSYRIFSIFSSSVLSFLTSLIKFFRTPSGRTGSPRTFRISASFAKLKKSSPLSFSSMNTSMICWNWTAAPPAYIFVFCLGKMDEESLL